MNNRKSIKSRTLSWGNECVILSRISTTFQDVSAQESDLKAYAEELGYKPIKVIPTTESGFLSLDKKGGWNIAADFFNNNPQCRVLVCTELSRLSRKQTVLHAIKDYLIENKIQLHVKDIHFTLFDESGVENPNTDIAFAMFASIAESEMRTKKERFKRAKHELKRQGMSLGGKVLFGYKREYIIKGNKRRSIYVIDDTPEENCGLSPKEQILTIYRWYAYGIDGDLSKTSISNIQRECIERGFNHYLHSKRNVNKCLKEEAYTGNKITHNRVHNAEYWNYGNHDAPKYIEGESYECTYPIILDGDNRILFDIVHERLLQSNSKVKSEGGVSIDKSSKHTTILSKLLICPGCGKPLVGEYRVRNGEDKFTYRCHKSRGVINGCDFKSAPGLVMMDSLTWTYIKGAAQSMIFKEFKQDSSKIVEEYDNKIANLKEERSNLDSQIEVAEDIYMRNTKSAKTREAQRAAKERYHSTMDEIESQQKTFDKRIAQLQREKARYNISSSTRNKEFLERVLGVGVSKQEIYNFIHQLVESINIVHFDRRYTILKVNPFISSPAMKEYDGYICIDKRNTLNLDVRSLNGYDYEKNKVEWSEESKSFFSKTSSVSLEDIFKTDSMLKPFDIHIMRYEKLTCYDEDRHDSKKPE